MKTRISRAGSLLKAVLRAKDKPLAYLLHSGYAIRGFTFIELMIVLAVMSLLLAFAAPRMAGHLAGLTLSTAAKRTASSLRYARSQALATGIPHAAIFDCERRQLIVTAVPRQHEPTLPEGSVVPEEPIEPPQRREIKIYKLPEEVRFDTIDIGDSRCNEPHGDSICQMVFYADGTSHGGTVTIMDERDRRYEIEVEVITGSVHLAEDREPS